MKKKTQNILLLIVGMATYIALIALSTQPDAYFGNVYGVHIINGFTNNSSLPLVVWCNSGDGDDIGGRALQERDDFSWSVKPTLWTNLLFSCTMKFDQQRRKFAAFSQGRDVSRCSPTRRCFWLVKEDGFYFSVDGINWRKDFSWI
nr:S-protein homolog 6-like [Ipomoea batatas]